MSVYPPTPPVATPGPASPQRRGCLRIIFYYNIGFWGGWLLLLGGALLLIVLFPPRQTNIVLLGLDRRRGQTIAARTDTMILTGIDGRAPAITMLSIPRDLWVQMPGGSGEQRINVAHRAAEINIPGSGPQAAMDVVAQNFGVAVDGYVRIDFEGFVGIIDSVGGIVIDVESPFFDFEYPTDDGGTMYVEFQAGEQRMDGERALQYARIRHGSSDFVRAKRQQQIISAFVQQVLKPTTWPRLPALYSALTTTADTDVGLFTMIRLFPILMRVGPDGLERIVMESPLVRAYTTPAGASVQLPIWNEVEPLLIDYFGKSQR